MMKLLPSSSCSSSSSFSTFDANSCNPKGPSPGCLSGILRRILCSGSLPTHPSDHITEEARSVKSDDMILQVKDASFKPAIQAKHSAGIVARLMGLETMPEGNVNSNLISRSQSMNSVEHLCKHLEGNHSLISKSPSMNSVEHFCKHLEGNHRRVRSTLSFREIPTFLELENEEFFILSFEDENGGKEFRSKPRTSKLGSAEEKVEDRGSNKTEQLSERRKKKKRIDPEEAKEYVLIDLRETKKSSRRITDKPNSKVRNNGRAQISNSTPISSKDRHGNQEVGSIAEKTASRRKSTRKLESECGADESSPVSVLDCSQFHRDSEVHLSGDNSSSPTHPRRKLSPELETFQNPSPRNDNNLIINERKVAKIADRDKWEAEICGMTDAELANSNWKYSRNCQEHEDGEEIFAGFESYIFDKLIDEIVEQMYDLPLEILNL